MEKLNEKNAIGATSRNHNVHNQFLQTALTLGIPGILALLAMFLVPAYFAIKRRNNLLIIFLLILVLNFLVESMLQHLRHYLPSAQPRGHLS